MNTVFSRNKEKRPRSSTSESNNSFVKNVTSRVLGLLPATITKWFSSPSSSNANGSAPAADISDSSTEDEATESPVSSQPPAKRMRYSTPGKLNRFGPTDTVSAKDPNMANVTSLSFRNNVPTSTMYMPRNIEVSREDQRSIRSRREVSPMSLASRTSVSAIDIAMALKNTQFNKHDLKIISEAYKKFNKTKIRKKFEKRRNLRLFLKGGRRRSGGESGEQGSDSSISDDDCRSNKTSIYKGNMSSCRSTKSDLTNIRRTMQESNIYNDCSPNFKQKSFKNMFSVDSGSLNSNICSKPHDVPLQKDRFKSGFLLPSQIVNKTVAGSTIHENVEKQPTNMYQKSAKENFAMNDVRANNFMSTTDSEHEEIFSGAPVIQKQLNSESQHKRHLEIDEETHTPHKKRNKLSPIENISDAHILNDNRNDCSANNKDEFIFDVNKNNMKSCAKSFWDTDLESDIECHSTQKRIITANDPPVPVSGKNLKDVNRQPKKVDLKQTAPPTANTSLLNNTTATVYELNNTSLSIKSHRTIKKKKCCDDDNQSNATLNQTQNKQLVSKDACCLSYTAFANSIKPLDAAVTVPDSTAKNVRNKRSCSTPKQNTENKLTIEVKTSNKTEANRSLRPRKTDLSSTTLDDEIAPKTRSKKQNASTRKANNKQIDKSKPAINSRKSDVSFTLNRDVKIVKTKPVAPKKLEAVNKSRELKSRPSNVSFSITSESPMTRSRSATKSNEQENGHRS